MSWNRIIFILLMTIGFASTSSYAKKMMTISEDELIIRAVLADEYKAYESSYQIYKKLFDDTATEIYLFKEATAALLGRKHITECIGRLKQFGKQYPDKLEVPRLLIPLYLTDRQVKNAGIEAEYLLEKSTDPIDLDLASNSFLYAGNFKRALALLNKIYETEPRESILLRMTAIMDEFTGERKKAIQLLEAHRRMNIVSKGVYARLILLYQKEQDVDGILETYKALYSQDKNEQYLTKIIDAYMHKRDIDGAITFLETNKSRNNILYELYKMKKHFAKALALVDVLYSEDKNSKWIAEKGILILENSKDKNDKQMIKSVIGYFEKAFKLGNDDSIYLNYYGYILIDKDLDVKKGMKSIKDALIQQPNNTYYLDSLAWGYYKERDCAKAYKVMKRVVEEEGLSEPEISEHWNAIGACK